jgi:cytochrome b subunit of formate dehydrogenase
MFRVWMGENFYSEEDIHKLKKIEEDHKKSIE